MRELRGHRGLGEHCSLGVPRRAASVHLVDIIVVGDDAIRRHGSLIGNPLAVVIPALRAARIDSHEPLDGLELAAECIHDANVGCRGNKHLGLGIVDNVDPLWSRHPVIEGNRHYSRLRGGVEQQGVFDAVLGEECDPIADPESGAHEGVCQPVHLDDRLSVGDAPVAEHGKVDVRLLTGVIVQVIVESHPSHLLIEERLEPHQFHMVVANDMCSAGVCPAFWRGSRTCRGRRPRRRDGCGSTL